MTEPGTNKKPRRSSGESGSRRLSILSAAESLFAERGYARSSMKDIAAVVGVTDAALYRHFDSKRSILESLYEDRGIFRSMEVLEHLEARLGIEDQFRENILGTARLWAESADSMRIIFMEALVGDDMAIEAHSSHMDRWRKGVERLYLVYADRSEVDPARSNWFAEAYVGLLFGALMERLLESRRAALSETLASQALLDRLGDEVALLIQACWP